MTDLFFEWGVFLLGDCLLTKISFIYRLRGDGVLLNLFYLGALSNEDLISYDLSSILCTSILDPS